MYQKNSDDQLMARYIRSDLKTLPPYTPIKPFDVVAEEIGLPISALIKLDANENSYGMLPEVSTDMISGQFNHIYPDPGQTYLRTDIANRHGIKKEMIVCGSGADDILDILIRLVPDRPIVTSGPTFGMYSFLGSVSKRQVIDVPRDSQTFQVDFDKVLSTTIASHATLLFLTSPNNPTGDIIPNETVKMLCTKLSQHCLVVIDEAYAEFSSTTCLHMIDDHPNLIVLRTFSKWAAIAGLRVGYSISNPLIARSMDIIKQPYNVSSVAELAARSALKNEALIRTQQIDKLLEERVNLYKLLSSYEWIHPVPNSQANFILCRISTMPAWLVASTLRAKGILIRYYSTNHLVHYIRISVGKPDDTEKLKAGLDSIQKECVSSYFKSLEAVLWDMDGVLADVSKSYRTSILETAKFWGVIATHEDLEKIKNEGNANNDWVVSKRLIDSKIEAGRLSPTLQEVTDKFEEIYQGTEAVPGLWKLESLVPSIELLKKLKSAFPKMGIVTGRPRHDANKFIQTFNLTEFFDVVVCMEDTPKPKPDPSPVKAALDALGVTKAVLIGDTPDDIMAATFAKIGGIGALVVNNDNPKTRAALEKCNPLATVNNLQQFLQILTEH